MLINPETLALDFAELMVRKQMYGYILTKFQAQSSFCGDVIVRIVAAGYRRYPHRDRMCRSVNVADVV